MKNDQNELANNIANTWEKSSAYNDYIKAMEA
jgi:hypothetical protein